MTATLELENGKEISISGFDLSIFKKAKQKIFLNRIDDVGLVCLTEKHNPSSRAAIDINSLLEVCRQTFQ